MSVRLCADVLRKEISARGTTLERFATVAHISPATLNRALAGRPVTPRVHVALAAALLRVPAVEGARELIDEQNDGAARGLQPQAARAADGAGRYAGS